MLARAKRELQYGIIRVEGAVFSRNSAEDFDPRVMEKVDGGELTANDHAEIAAEEATKAANKAAAEATRIAKEAEKQQAAAAAGRSARRNAATAEATEAAQKVEVAQATAEPPPADGQVPTSAQPGSLRRRSTAAARAGN